MLKSLPPELWICIFHHATHVPDTLIPEVYAYASLVGSVGTKSSDAAIRATLATKRALVRVCKQWWHLAIPYLYRSIYIWRAHSLPFLLNALVRSAAGDTLLGTACPFGEYTQRLDVAVRTQDRAGNVAAQCNSLAPLITCMPHLAIVSFVFAPSCYTPSTNVLNNILNALQCSAASLRVLEWSLITLIPSTFRITDLLAKCTELRFLNCSQLVWSKELGYGGVPPSVTTLRVHTLDPILSTASNKPLVLNPDPGTARQSEPSALRELILDLHRDAHYWEDLLRVYSHQLVSVQFYVSNNYSINIEENLQLLARICPNLSRLTIAANHFAYIIRPHLVFPSITHLALRIIRTQSRKTEYEAFFAFLAQLRSSVPSLQVVQLLNERNVQCLFKTHTRLAVRALRPFLEASMPLRVEDVEGVLLTDRLQALGYL